MHQDGIHGGDERVRRNDDFVAGPDAQGRQRGDERARSVGDGQAVLGAQGSRPCGFELIGIIAA